MIISSVQWALVYFLFDPSLQLKPSNVLGIRSFYTEQECVKVMNMEIELISEQRNGYQADEIRSSASGLRVKCLSVEVPDKM